jgi:hypothetical protein
MVFRRTDASIISLILSYHIFHLTGSSAVLKGAAILFLAILTFA